MAKISTAGLWTALFFFTLLCLALNSQFSWRRESIEDDARSGRHAEATNSEVCRKVEAMARDDCRLHVRYSIANRDHGSTKTGRRRGESRTPLLTFLYNMLSNPLYTDYITWKDFANGVFKISNPEGVAQMWGQQRGHKNMTYEKMSRGLRHYYGLNLLKKVNIRGCYQFTQMNRISEGIFENFDFMSAPCTDPFE